MVIFGQVFKKSSFKIAMPGRGSSHVYLLVNLFQSYMLPLFFSGLHVLSYLEGMILCPGYDLKLHPAVTLNMSVGM